MATMNLSEEAIEDILYFARTADLAELQATFDQISKDLGAPPHDVLAAAKDIETGNTALHMAAANGHTEVIKLLLSLAPVPATSAAPGSSSLEAPPALIDAANNVGNTPLHYATINGHLEAVKALVDAGADLTAKNSAGHDVVYEAELNGKEEVVSWLLGASNEEDVVVKEEEAAAENLPGEGISEAPANAG